MRADRQPIQPTLPLKIPIINTKPLQAHAESISHSYHPCTHRNRLTSPGWTNSLQMRMRPDGWDSANLDMPLLLDLCLLGKDSWPCMSREGSPSRHWFVSTLNSASASIEPSGTCGHMAHAMHIIPWQAFIV